MMVVVRKGNVIRMGGGGGQHCCRTGGKKTCVVCGCASCGAEQLQGRAGEHEDRTGQPCDRQVVTGLWPMLGGERGANTKCPRATVMPS